MLSSTIIEDDYYYYRNFITTVAIKFIFFQCQFISAIKLAAHLNFIGQKSRFYFATLARYFATAAPPFTVVATLLVTQTIASRKCHYSFAFAEQLMHFTQLVSVTQSPLLFTAT